MQSIQAARGELESMRDCNEKRGAEIALTHAEVMAAVAERLFSSALGRQSQGADKAIADPYAIATMKDLEPEVE